MRWYSDGIIHILLVVFLLAGCTGRKIGGESLPPQELTAPTLWPGGADRIRLWKNEGKGFLPGANYPWWLYGHDFGVAAPWPHDGVSSDASRFRIDSDFSFMAKKGVHVLRWFLFGDGRAAPDFDANGVVTGLDAFVFKDMDTALSLAARHNIYIVFVLLDFKIARTPEDQNGVEVHQPGPPQVGDRVEMFLPVNRVAFMEKALLPLIKRYGNHPNVLAWEVMNEPEGAMRREGKDYPIDPAHMTDFIKEAVDVIHQNSSAKVTVGSKSRKHLDLWTDVGLDFYQYHYYERLEATYPLAYPYKDMDAALKLQGKPVVVGEFPTKDDTRHSTPYNGSLTKYMNVIRDNGYAGAWPWSYGAVDDYSDFSAVISEYTVWAKQYEEANSTMTLGK
jgi:hypothetical protein